MRLDREPYRASDTRDRLEHRACVERAVDTWPTWRDGVTVIYAGAGDATICDVAASRTYRERAERRAQEVDELWDDDCDNEDGW